MIEAMKQLALWILANECDSSADDANAWYAGMRESNADQLLKWLVEAPDSAERFYTLSASDSDDSVAVLKAHELTPQHSTRLPFCQPTGSQSAALGPIVKRTFASKKSGPSKKIQDTTLQAFSTIGSSDEKWAEYFHDAHECFSRPTLYNAITDKTYETKHGAFNKYIEVIIEKRTVLLCYETADGKLPGEVTVYQSYLSRVLAETKYTTGKASEVSGQSCSLCGEIGIVLPNGIKGAGINFANVDREGAFPSMDIDECWKHFWGKRLGTDTDSLSY